MDGEGATIEDMGVDHGRLNVFVAKQLLNGADIITIFKQVRGESVAEDVRSDALLNMCFASGVFDRSMEAACVNVVPANSLAAGVC